MPVSTMADPGQSPTEMGNGQISQEGGSIPTSRSTSRFTVARVDRPPDEASVCIEPDQMTVKSVAFQVGDEHDAGDTLNTHTSADTYQRTYAHNTIDQIPHLNHYRNLMSIEGDIRQRPTLDVLMGEQVRSFNKICSK